MEKPYFDLTDPFDIAAFKEILGQLPPIDRRIARLMLKGYTRLEICPYIARSKTTVYRHVRQLEKYFAVEREKINRKCS